METDTLLVDYYRETTIYIPTTYQFYKSIIIFTSFANYCICIYPVFFKAFLTLFETLEVLSKKN